MATGWARDGAVQEQIDASVDDAVELARSRLPSGDSLSHCEECAAEIPEALKRQLRIDGRMVLPLGDGAYSQRLTKITRKAKEQFSREPLASVSFVPLIGDDGI